MLYPEYSDTDSIKKLINIIDSLLSLENSRKVVVLRDKMQGKLDRKDDFTVEETLGYIQYLQKKTLIPRDIKKDLNDLEKQISQPSPQPRQHTPEALFYEAFSKISKVNSRTLTLKEQAEKLHEFRSHRELTMALKNYLGSNPNYLKDLALSTPYSAVLIVGSSTLGSLLNDKEVADIIYHHRQQAFKGNLPEYFNNVENLLKPTNRSIEKLLAVHNPAREILLKSSLFKNHPVILGQAKHQRAAYTPAANEKNERKHQVDDAYKPTDKTQRLHEMGQQHDLIRLATKAEHNYYEIFGIETNASKETIKDKLLEAKRANAKAVNQGGDKDAIQMKNARIGEATKIFNDPELKAIYDRNLNKAQPEQIRRRRN